MYNKSKCKCRDSLEKTNAPVGARLRIKTRSCDGVHLVNENNRRRILLGQAEHVAHHARPLDAPQRTLTSDSTQDLYYLY